MVTALSSYGPIWLSLPNLNAYIFAIKFTDMCMGMFMDMSIEKWKDGCIDMDPTPMPGTFARTNVQACV